MLSLTLVSCGSAGTPAAPAPPTAPTPTSPAPPPAPSGPPTVTITSSGFSPLEVTVPIGGRVLFVNNDRTGHEIWGGVDHESRDCPEVEVAGFLVANQSRETATFTAAKTCRFHDHANLGNPAYQGRIFVQ